MTSQLWFNLMLKNDCRNNLKYFPGIILFIGSETLFKWITSFHAIFLLFKTIFLCPLCFSCNNVWLIFSYEFLVWKFYFTNALQNGFENNNSIIMNFTLYEDFFFIKKEIILRIGLSCFNQFSSQLFVYTETILFFFSLLEQDTWLGLIIGQKHLQMKKRNTK